MKRFRFPLRPVAVLRAHSELRAREAFALSIQTYVESEKELNATRARVAQFEAALFARRAERFSPTDEVQNLAAYRREWLAEIEAERAMVAARTAMDERRVEYLDAHRKVEVVKRLEDKARSAHRHEIAREEQAEFDEFSSRRFVKHRSALST